MSKVLAVLTFLLVAVLLFSIGFMLYTGTCTVAMGVSNAAIAIIWILYGNLCTN